MAITATRVVLFLIGLFAAAGVVGYGTGMFGTRQVEPGSELASLPQSGETGNQAGEPSPSASVPPADGAMTAPQAEPGAASPEASTPQAGEAPAAGAASEDAPVEVVAPKFDLLRVESDGSVVVAGQAAPGSRVEIMSGDQVVGQGAAGPAGDFAIVLDTPLAPGDYSLVLRSTSPRRVATSVETAVVSVPEATDGQVLAMVEQPGEPSRLITVPETEAAQGSGQASDPAAPQGEQASTAEQPAQTAQPAAGETDVAAAPQQQAPSAQEAAPATAGMVAPTVEAVEIEGDRIFIAGRAPEGSRLRVYADDMLLGETMTSAGGNFLLEARRELPVGNYTIRVDSIASDGSSVLARAAVPFEREPGEAVAAVAPTPSTSGSASGGTAAPATGSASTSQADVAVPSAEGSEAIVSNPPAIAGQETQTSGAASGGSSAAVASNSDTATTAPKLQSAQGAVIIRRGDSLWRISKRAYGRGVRYSTIYLANQDQIADPDRIWPGQIFRMPETTQEGERADMDQLGDQATTSQQ